MNNVIDKIEAIIAQTIVQLNKEWKNPNLASPASETPLFGVKGHLDSHSLVVLLAELEEKLSDAFNKTIFLADDRAMSQKLSPFRTVNALAQYVDRLLREG
ncbi:MAG TPA: hypothetical protein VJL89_13055 [Thermodesulfovibrionia bacterium]|nr:hypothetical protein [Thermodesulfovibrionia bacterium]